MQQKYLLFKWVYQVFNRWNLIENQRLKGRHPASAAGPVHRGHMANGSARLSLKTLNPAAETVLSGRSQTEFSAGFQQGVKHAVAITPAAGQEEAAAAVSRFFAFSLWLFLI